MTPRDVGRRLVAGATAAAVLLLVVSLAAGGWGHGSGYVHDPCVPREVLEDEGGTDARAQRIVLGGLAGAACRLGIGREELVLDYGRRQRLEDVPGGKDRAESALRAGLSDAVGQAQDRGDLNAIEAFVLRQVVERVPLDTLLDALKELQDRL